MPFPASASCGTCRFADIAMGEDGPVVECHRFPPVGNPGGMSLEAQHEVGSDPVLDEMFEDAVMAVAEIDFPRWPRVLESDWCGEYVVRRVRGAARRVSPSL